MVDLMAIWRKTRRPFPRYEPPEEFTPPPLDTLVEEGELIALAGVRMRVKNQIILRTVRDGAAFDLDWGVEAVRSQLESLAREATEDARRLGGKVAGRRRDTKRDDLTLYEPERLPRRQEMLTMLAERLEALTADESRVRELAIAARDAALDDLVAGRVVMTTRMPVAAGSVEAAERAEALAQLSTDLDALGAALSRGRSQKR
jgi:hypothetical protein